MKLIEKLGMRWSQENLNPHLSVSDNVEYAFEAGFREALEMATAKLHDHCIEGGACGLIESLGYEEVKE